MLKVLNEMAHEQCQGVFWDIDGELLSFPFVENQYTDGVAKSGETYNHKLLWNQIKPKGCNKSFDYYPRGRVVIDNKNRPIIYMNPNVSDKLLPQIKVDFGLRTEPKIVYDNSRHYRCHYDDGYGNKY